uniref:Uncharacterized protein n=1 Tax=Tanacetum cinerariifolium TaxID=118510 RepID=A0A6L2M7Z0_TANCI|nr:hypothetical protein [Tanacetum cinerariifolium]
MGEPLSPDRVFDFSMNESEPQHGYDFFAPGLLSDYAGAEVVEQLVDPMIEELAKPIVEVEEQMATPVMDMEEDLAMLFGVEEDSSNDEFEGPEGDEEVGGSYTATAEGHSLTLLAPGVPVPLSVIEDLCTRMGNLEYGHGLLVKKVITVSNAEVADSIAIGEIGLRVSTVKGQMQVMASQMVQVVSGLEQVQTLQATVQHKDMQIQQLQTLVTEMSSRDGTLMQCLLGLDRRLADVERRPPGPQ